MRARTRLIAFGALLIGLGSTLAPAAQEAAGDAGGRLVLSVKDGKHWRHSFRVMLVRKVTTEPQMAFWLEDQAGNFVATIFVTHRAATDDWRATLGEDRAGIRRPSALPVWRHRHQSGGVQPPASCTDCHAKRRAEDRSTEGVASLDAITGATPASGFNWEWSLPAGVRPGVYVVKAEINQSKDFTDVYRANLPETDPNYNGGKSGSGQPSLVWQATIDVGGGPALATLKPVGHGHPSGASGEVFPDLSTLTTALEIVDSIKVSYVPER